jgi:lipopolysaccharide export system protein LptA
MTDRRLLVLALIASAPAWALKSDRDQDMTINADRSVGEGDHLELIGNVRIDQGSLKIRAARAVIDRKNGEIDRVVFDGSPATLQQQVENQGTMNAAAANIDYRPGEDKVVLTGGVRIQQPRGDMQSERVVYHVATGLIDAGDQSGGVTMTLKPKSRPAAGN